MRVMTSLAVTVAVAAVSIAPADAARRIAIDIGDSNFAANGQIFLLADSTELDVEDDASTGALALGFDIDYGDGPVGSLFVNENGAVSFGSAIPAPFTSAASLASLGRPVIAPFYADLVSVTPEFPDGIPDFGAVLFQTGVADPFPDGGGYSLDDTLPAARITWNGLDVLDDADNVIGEAFAQLVIYDQGDGDFDLEFLYGGFSDDQADLGSLAGFVLGANSFSIDGPYTAATRGFFSFRDGVLVDTPPVDVPEPATGLALLFGAGLLGALRRSKGARPLP